MLYLSFKNLLDVNSSSVGVYLVKLVVDSVKLALNSNKLVIFFSEGCYIDSLQKLSLSSVLTNLTILSTQFFNMNYLNYKFISFFMDDIYKFFNHMFMMKADFSFAFILQSLLFFMLFLFQIILLVEVLFTLV